MAVTGTVVVFLVAVLAVLVARWLVQWVAWYRRFRKLEQAIPGPPALPILGNALDFVGLADTERLAYLLKSGRREMTRFSLFGKLFVMASNAEDIEQIMRRKDLSDKSHFFYGMLHIVARHGLLQINGQMWREHRKALQPAFSKTILEQFVEHFADEAEGFVRRCQPLFSSDALLENLRRVSSGVFLRTTLSEEVGEDFEEEIMGLLRFLDQFLCSVNARSFQPLLWNNYIYALTPAGRLILKTKTTIDHYAHTILNKRRAELSRMTDHGESDFVKRPKTLVDILLQSDYKMPDEDAVDEFKTFFAASVDTTAATLMWLLKALSLHPDLQDKVHAEIQAVFEGSDRKVTPDDIPRLAYTDRFIKETMRLFPTVPFVARAVRAETQLCGYTLPADTTVAVNILAAHRDPVHWPDPLRFDPDRFLPENSEDRHPCSYMPFSNGSRNCIGGKYALMNMKTFLATLLRRYRVDPVDDGYGSLLDIPIYFDLALRAVGGMTVRFTPRMAAAQ